MTGIIRPSSVLQFSLNSGCMARCLWSCRAVDEKPAPYGNMAIADWLKAIRQAPALGIRRLRFVGCEPTRHAGLRMVIGAAKDAGLVAELHTSLFHVSPEMWDMLCELEVALVVQLHGDTQLEHDAIDGRSGAYARLIAGCQEAATLGVTYQLCSPTEAEEMQQIRAYARHLTILATGRVCRGMPYTSGMEVIGNAIYQPLEDLMAKLLPTAAH